MSVALTAPFPYFGSKRRIAHEIWRGLGDVDHYVEPFAGSLATLLARPHPPRTRAETINDACGFVANFWRAVSAAPAAVAAACDWPVSELDLHARQAWLIDKAKGIDDRLRNDPEYFDVKIAGWWAWGLSIWIGGGWCADFQRRRPQLGLPAGQGVVRLRAHDALDEQLARLCDRLRNVRVLCGDWSRAVSPSVCFQSPNQRTGTTVGILLDPPYSHSVRDPNLYRCEADISLAVREWAIEHGSDPRVRIALCGLSTEHHMPDTWRCLAWSASGAANFKGAPNNKSRHDERVWFSPHCLPIEQQRDLWTAEQTGGIA